MLRRSLVLTLVAIATAAGAGALALHDAADAPVATVTVDAAHPGGALPRSFLGFSMEIPAVGRYAGTAARPNRPLAAMLRTLASVQGSPLSLRLGGNSSDESWWAPGSHTRPRLVRYVLGPSWLARAAWLQRASHGPVTVGLNLAADDPRRALAFARALRRALPAAALRTLEIGNEPDLFTHGMTFRAGRTIVRRIARRDRYGTARYAADVRNYAKVLSSGLGARPALSAGGFAGVAWDAVLRPLLRAERHRISALSAHAYPLDGCPGHAPRATQLGRLLSDRGTRSLADGVARMVTIGRRAGVPVSVTEMNSATCGGVPGISDTVASALWAPGALFEMARVGVHGVDLHAWPGAPYAPFAFSGGRSTTIRMQARPLLYGLLLFAEATGHGSRMLHTGVATNTGVRAWATLSRTRGVRVVMVNPGAEAVQVSVALGPSARRPAALRLLRTPGGLGARGQLSFGGRAFGADGGLHGHDHATRVLPVAGSYAVSLPSASGGLLTLAPATHARITTASRPARRSRRPAARRAARPRRRVRRGR